MLVGFAAETGDAEHSVLDFGRGNVTFKQRRGFTATDQWTPVFVTAEDPRIESELVKMDTTIAQMLGQPA